MPEKKPLNAKSISSIPTPNKTEEHYDSVVPGLAVRVTRKGSKSFVFRYWYDGKSKQRTIGRVGTYSLKEARDKVKEWRKLLDDGIDPRYEKKRNLEEKVVTVKDYLERFKVDHVKRRLRPSTQKTYNSRIDKLIDSELADIPIRELSKANIKKYLDKESVKHPVNANRLHSILSSMLNQALSLDVIDKNPMLGLKKIQEIPRDKVYSDNEIKEIWKAIENEWDPLRSFLKILFLTGKRSGEAKRMQWDHIDDNWIWRIHSRDTKNKVLNEVPLSQAAINLIEKLRPISGESIYVFRSLKSNDKHVSEFGNVTERIRKKSGVVDFRLHDIRHIIATRMASLGIAQEVVEKTLHHISGSGNPITRLYNNHDYREQKRDALNIWSGHLAQIVTDLKSIKQSS
jgi:integrase